MARSRAARAALTTQRKKRTTARTTGNRFAVLDVEQPFNYFPLMQLPRELRDRIYEDVITNGRLWEDRHSDACGDLAGVDIAIGLKAPRIMPLGCQSPWPRPKGALAVPLVSKQVHEEYREAVLRVMPHRVRGALMGERGDGEATSFRDDLLSSLPVAACRIYIDNFRTKSRMCDFLDEDVQSRLLAAGGKDSLLGYLRARTSATEIAIDWCTSHCRSHEPSIGLHPPDAFQDAVVEALESLPNLQQYSFRGCAKATYGSRVKGQPWEVTRAYRTESGDLDGISLAVGSVVRRRWGAFLVYLGGRTKQLNWRRVYFAGAQQ